MLSTFRFLSFIVGAVAFYLAGSYYLHLAFISIGLVVPTMFSNGNDTLSTIVALLIYWQVGVPYLTFFWNEVVIKLTQREPLSTIVPTAGTRWFLWMAANLFAPLVTGQFAYILMWEYFTVEKWVAAFVGFFCFVLTGGAIYNAAVQFNVALAGRR